VGAARETESREEERINYCCCFLIGGDLWLPCLGRASCVSGELAEDFTRCMRGRLEASPAALGGSLPTGPSLLIVPYESILQMNGTQEALYTLSTENEVHTVGEMVLSLRTTVLVLRGMNCKFTGV
jgi:hypothetical protein